MCNLVSARSTAGTEDDTNVAIEGKRKGKGSGKGKGRGKGSAKGNTSVGKKRKKVDQSDAEESDNEGHSESFDENAEEEYGDDEVADDICDEETGEEEKKNEKKVGKKKACEKKLGEKKATEKVGEKKAEDAPTWTTQLQSDAVDNLPKDACPDSDLPESAMSYTKKNDGCRASIQVLLKKKAFYVHPVDAVPVNENGDPITDAKINAQRGLNLGWFNDTASAWDIAKLCAGWVG